MDDEFDIVVVGGGLVGAACALALCRQGWAVALVESRPADAAPDATLDDRIYAISPGNAAWLQTLGVWQMLDPQHFCSIDRMQVHGDANAARIDFDADEAHADNLGLIVENKRLQHVLWQGLQQSDAVLLTGTACSAATWRDSAATLTLADGRSLTAQLLIAADGAESWLRTQGGIGVHRHDYAQMGVVANFDTAVAHGNTARQWFRPDGVLAWLPLPGQRMSMVWSTSMAHADHLLALEAEALAEEVAAAGGQELGALRTLNTAQAFPLRLQTAECLVKPGLALVGDAAHTIHPLAGQGVNLGFRDVIALTQTLAQRHPRQLLGDIMLLRRFERARKTDMLAMRALTDGLQRLFAADQPLVRRARNWGLRLTDRLAPVKKRLIRQATL
jgi:ubiquinone biosynthesis UbiH/UbiF/VisC/COQ6 family hydroxylase